MKTPAVSSVIVQACNSAQSYQDLKWTFLGVSAEGIAYIVFVWTSWKEVFRKVTHTSRGGVWFCPLPSTHTFTARLLIIRDKKCWLLITRGWACGMLEAATFVLSPDIKTHIWIRCDGCIITTMTSHPIDKTDGRQDSWQHGTKLVWAAVPSAVCCHDRGGSYYLHGCPPSLPAWADWLGAGQWGGERGGLGWLRGYPGNERMDWSGPSLCPSSASSVHCGG